MVFWDVSNPEYGGYKVFQNVDIISHHHTASQPGIPQLESSSPLIPHISQRAYSNSVSFCNFFNTSYSLYQFSVACCNVILFLEYLSTNRLYNVEVFWVTTPCSDVIGYQGFGSPCCLHLQGEVNGTVELTLALDAFRPILLVDPWGQGIEPCMGSWPVCTGETAVGDSYCYLLPEGRRGQTRIGVLTLLYYWIGGIVTLISL
jgi:hypothetical protein